MGRRSRSPTPRGCAIPKTWQHAVPVGDGDVGLAGGDVGDEERDEPELLSVDGPLLLEMHVVAHHLVAPQQRSAVHVRGHHDAVAADLRTCGARRR